MNYDWQTVPRPTEVATAALLPPPTVEETAWDILLALHTDRRCKLNLHELESVVSAPRGIIGRWLTALEQRQLITGIKDKHSGEVCAILTDTGRELLDNYLLATGTLLTMLAPRQFFDDPEKDPDARAN